MATLPAEQRVLTIFAHQAGATVSVSFDDRGAGVPEAEQSRLFEPFHTTKLKGTGLGLSTSLRIVQAHGGTLAYETNSHGGARFVLSLPVAAADAATTGAG
jgi:signal transduction histidine kinase